MTAVDGKKKALTFQELLFTLQRFWAERGCVLQQPYDVEVGAGTMSPDTFLRVLGPKPVRDCVRAAFAAAGGRAVWGESEPAVPAYADAGDSEAATGECAGAVSGVAGGDRELTCASTISSSRKTTGSGRWAARGAWGGR